jgi:hypothetical protein
MDNMKGRPGTPRKSHGMTGTKEHRCWISMRHRCNNPKNKKYHLYGGAGVKVDPDWDRTFGGFEAFIAYMGKCPPDKNSIDRWPNPNGNYEPGNVRWANDQEQNNNKRTNHLFTFNGRTQTIAQWSRETGVAKLKIGRRIAKGWPPHLVLSTRYFRGLLNRWHRIPS